MAGEKSKGESCLRPCENDVCAVYAKSFQSSVSNSATPWTSASQASLSMGFSRQEYWSGFPFPSPGDLPNPGIKPRCPALQADSLLFVSPRKPNIYRNTYMNYSMKYVTAHILPIQFWLFEAKYGKYHRDNDQSPPEAESKRTKRTSRSGGHLIWVFEV